MIDHEPEHKYRTRGVCAMSIHFDLDEEERVHDVLFFGGCEGNHKGLSALVEGMPARDVIARLEGTTCGPRTTSCPDQLAQVLREALEQR